MQTNIGSHKIVYIKHVHKIRKWRNLVTAIELQIKVRYISEASKIPSPKAHISLLFGISCPQEVIDYGLAGSGRALCQRATLYR